jgi:exopolysaccharide biosynthesis protein
LVRDALGSQSPNARSAVGLKPDGTVVLAIAAQRLDQEAPTGLSFQELAEFLASLGVAKALNLDGGSSTGLYVEGQTTYGRLNDENQPVQRPIKSILLVQ